MAPLPEAIEASAATGTRLGLRIARGVEQQSVSDYTAEIGH
jgi:hypothetical protein